VGTVCSRRIWLARLWGGAAALAACAVMAAIGSASALAQPPYEPNDSLLTGYGPLANNATYQAALETENDVDYYYFYVTTLSSAQLTFTVTNLGGGTSPYVEVYARLTDSHGNTITTLADNVEAADYATRAVTLGAGKYYVEVENDDYYGEAYKFTTSGTEGAFGEYGAIQAQCAAATVPVATYQSQLAIAEANRKKAEARLDKVLSHRSTRRARRRARAKLRHVKETVAAEKASLKAAEAGQKPWCYIPQ
jgi:hypothetical protein